MPTDLNGDFLLYWAIAAAVVGFIASARQRGFLGFFLLSLILSPIIGLVVLLTTGSGEQRAPCWQCREQVIVGALKCSHCGADLAWPETPAKS